MPETAVYAPGTPIWVDVTTPDPAGTKKFYSQVFGWEPQTTPEPEAGGYTLFMKDGQPIAGMGPQMNKEMPPTWTTYILTENVDETTKKVKSAGGKVLMEPMTVMTAGRMAMYQDPTGAVIAAWQAGDHKGAGMFNVPNTLSWNELNTRNVKGAEPFYSQVFGWEPAPTPDGSYTEWKLKGKSIGGMMPMPSQVPAEVPAHWLAYFAVSNTDATVSKVQQMGGKVLMPAMDIPQGRFAVVADNNGAPFAVIQLKQ